jgi:hypothetical protein
MTDWQVWEILLNPAKRQLEELDPKFKAKQKRRREAQREKKEGFSISKDEYTAIGLRLGGTKEQLGEMYDKQLATMKKEAGDG